MENLQVILTTKNSFVVYETGAKGRVLRRPYFIFPAVRGHSPLLFLHCDARKKNIFPSVILLSLNIRNRIPWIEKKTKKINKNSLENLNILLQVDYYLLLSSYQ